MLFDELDVLLHSFTPDIKTIVTFWQNSGLETTFQDLFNKSQDVNFWQDPHQTDILRELQRVRLLQDQYLYIVNSHKDLVELLVLLKDDEAELTKLKNEVIELSRAIRKFKITLLLSDQKLLKLQSSAHNHIWMILLTKMK